jgi:hypothetical protein
VEVLQRYAKLPIVASDLRRALTVSKSPRRKEPERAPYQPKALRRRLGENALNQMIADYQAGWTARQLADRYGIAKTSVQNHLHLAGVEVRGRNSLPPEQITHAAALYATGLSLDVVGAVLGVSGSTVYRYFDLAGLPVRRRPNSPVRHSLSLPRMGEGTH